MDVQQLEQQLRESEQRNEALAGELASLQASHDGIQKELAAVRRDYQALTEATQVVTEEREALRARAAELEAANQRLVDMLWGRRSERRSESPDQQHLDFGDAPVDVPNVEEQEIIAAQAKADEALEEELRRRRAERRKKRLEKKGRREEFPPHIERRERVIDLPEEEKRGLHPLRVDVTERLRFEKPHVYVEVIKRPLYVVPGKPEAGVRSMPPPLSIVESCKYDFSVVAAAAAMKFGFHMPTYREQDWFAQWGWYPGRSTINDLINYAVDVVTPLHEQMWRLLLQDPILLGDDTRLCVLLRGALDGDAWAKLGQRARFRQEKEAGQASNTGPPGSATSYAWLYTGLDGLSPFNVFFWSLTHENAVIDGHLAGFRGTFVGDAAGANARLEQRSGGRIVHASCNAHARREFVKAESNGPVLASQAISFYQQLYDVEERGKALEAAARRELRQREAVPIWARMGRWLESERVEGALPRSAIGQALGYLRNQWRALQVYLGDGRIPIDNDQSEQTLRSLTVGRGNWMFLGHPAAAPGRLRMYSVVSSAHRHHLMVEDYLEDVLRQLADAQQNHPADLAPGSPYLLALLPDRWASAHPQSVRQGRVEEREAVSDAKRWRRLRQRIEARAARTSPTG